MEEKRETNNIIIGRNTVKEAIRSGRDIDAYFFVSNDAGKTYYASSASGHEKNVVQAKKDNEAIKNGTYEQ